MELRLSLFLKLFQKILLASPINFSFLFKAFRAKLKSTQSNIKKCMH